MQGVSRNRPNTFWVSKRGTHRFSSYHFVKWRYSFVICTVNFEKIRYYEYLQSCIFILGALKTFWRNSFHQTQCHIRFGITLQKRL